LEACRQAFELLRGGALALDACVEAATIVEDDPNEITVGYGGLPNEDGEVELDAAVMDGRTHRAGGVAALRNVRHPTQVARLVMQRTDRVLLAGEGARRFALANGFREENLLTDRARRMWLYWRRTRSGRNDWLPPGADEQDLDVEEYFRRHFDLGPQNVPHGTVHFAAIDASGDLACATSTSGHAFKLAGRVGDSPIVGAGLYVDNDIGTCGSLGRGESNQENLSSFAAVQLMRSGRSPLEAALDVLRQIARKTAPRHLDEQGRLTFDLRLFLLGRDGTHAAVCTHGPRQLAVSDEQGTRLENCVPLYDI
jgi:N4-(beta-N-acetylglucosaminyl)-L-asparaginase